LGRLRWRWRRIGRRLRRRRVRRRLRWIRRRRRRFRLGGGRLWRGGGWGGGRGRGRGARGGRGGGGGGGGGWGGGVRGWGGGWGFGLRGGFRRRRLRLFRGLVVGIVWRGLGDELRGLLALVELGDLADRDQVDRHRLDVDLKRLRRRQSEDAPGENEEMTN